MTFKSAVEATPEIQDAWNAGLQALRQADHRHIQPAESRHLSGSVNLDEALKHRYPSDQRWDYGIGYRSPNGSSETVYWVEVHPASSGEVKEVLGKLAWLKNWLGEKAPKLNAMRREFVWISSGVTSLTLSSTQAKRFALLGLRHTGRRLRIRD